MWLRPTGALCIPEAGHFEAPNWMHDGAAFIFNEDGRIKRLGVKGGEPQVIDTGSNVHCNNDHGISPDGKWLVISDGSQPRSAVEHLHFAD